MVLRRLDYPDDNPSYSFDPSDTAARLNSPAVFDRFGTVAAIDGFENTLAQWTVQLSGTSAAAAINTARCFTGAQSVLLTSGTTLLRYSRILRKIPLYTKKKSGISCFIGTTVNSRVFAGSINYKQAGVTLAGGFAVNFFNAPVALPAGIGVLSSITIPANSFGIVEDFAGNFIQLGSSGDIVPTASDWYPIKLIIDQETGKYHRLLFCSDDFDISQYPLFSVFLGAYDSITVELGAYGNAAAVSTLHIDNFIMTTNEE